MRIFIYVIIFMTGFLLGDLWTNSEFMQIDSCLDKGGRWNEEKYCEFRKAE